MTTPDPIVLIVQRRDFALLDAAACALFGKVLDDTILSHFEALVLVSAFMRTRIENAASAKVVTQGGDVLGTAQGDRHDAVRAAAEEFIRDCSPEAAADTSLFIHVARSVWERLTRHPVTTLYWPPSS